MTKIQVFIKSLLRKMCEAEGFEFSLRDDGNKCSLFISKDNKCCFRYVCYDETLEEREKTCIDSVTCYILEYGLKAAYKDVKEMSAS